MKICIPVETNNGMESMVYGHFGSAPYFAVYDVDTRGLEMIENDDSQHVHGMCNPLGALEGKNIGAVICCGMGARAVAKLNASGIKAFRKTQGTIEDVVRDFAANRIEEITSEGACQGHGCH
jgi:predicted Fe-Mo cluster-binding NifX family protein